MKLLISPVDRREALAAIEGGADIIDVKNPAEGSLGANFPWVIKEIKGILPSGLEISATLGDLDFRPGFASLAAYGLSVLGLDYIKAGLLVGEKKEAIKISEAIVRASKEKGCRVVLAAYADHKITGSINPESLPEVADAVGAHVVMIDTYNKNGSTLFDHMTMERLHGFINSAKELGLNTALAGAIKTEHLPYIKELSPDIVGVRGAVCTENNRLKGRIVKEKIKEFKKQLNSK